MKKANVFIQKTPTKVIRPDNYCRVCRCSPAVLGRGKCNLFHGKTTTSRDTLAKKLSRVLDVPVVKVDGVSSIICYKCKREVEKYENYMKALEVDLKEFKNLYQRSFEEQCQSQSSEERVKRCHNIVSPASSKKRSCSVPTPPKRNPKRLILPKNCEDLVATQGPNYDDFTVATSPGTRTEVYIHYPSKTIVKVVEDELTARIIRQVATGEFGMATGNIMKHETLREAVLIRLEKEVQDECKGVCSRSNPSILSRTSPECLVKLTDTAVVKELESRIPTFYRFMKAVVTNPRHAKGKKFDLDGKMIPAISMASSLLLRSRCSSMAANAYRFSILLWHGGVDKQFYSRACSWGVCMSHKSTLHKIDEMGKNFDQRVLEWKNEIEHDCNVEKMLETVQETVQEMTEIIPEGLETLDVSTLGLSSVNVCPTAELPGSAEQTIEMEINYTNKETEDLLSYDDPDLRMTVQSKLGVNFDKAIYDETMEVLKNYGCDLEKKSISSLRRILQLGHAARFQITGDNIDLLIKVKHMSSSNQNKSIHWFNLNAVLDRVLGNELISDQPIRSIMDMENVCFLPSPMDNQKLLNDFIPLAARVIADNIPAFSSFQNAVVRHIPHPYSDVMKLKSTQVPLGLMFKNENKNEEMLDILQDLHEKYVPVADTVDSSGKVVLDKVFFGGDQLTDERSRNARDARSDGDNEYERLEGVIPKVEDWHAIRILYQILFDIHFKPSSVNDVGSMCSNMNVINNVNAKTSNVMDNFNTCKDYVNIETDALITAAALRYFNMASLDTAKEEVIPPQVLNGTRQKKRVWLHQHVKKMLEVHVMDKMSTEHDDIRAAVHAASQPRQRQVKLCSVCGKPYVYEKALQNHMDKEHSGHEQSISGSGIQTNTSSDKESPEESTKKPITDDRYNYSCIQLRMGMLLRNFDDAVKEGDGERILRCWKIALLIFRAYGHTKYALCALQLIAATEALLTPRQACCLTWNRTVNNKGGPGRNISLDLRLEHINNLTKGMLKNLGPNISESSAVRCSKSVNMIERLLDSLDDDLKVYKPSGHHKSKKSKHDFQLLVEELHNKGNVFEFKPSQERAYQHFPQFQRSLLRSIDYRLLNKWITDHRKEMARNE